MSENGRGVDREANHDERADGVEETARATASTDAAYMRRCLELARHALSAGDVPVGALVVREGHVIGEGFERTRARLDPTAHAEVEALRAACQALGTLDLSGATLYTTVEPCVLCAYAVRHARVGRVVFGIEAGALGGASGRYPLLIDTTQIAGASPPVVQGGVLAEQCTRLLGKRRA